MNFLKVVALLSALSSLTAVAGSGVVKEVLLDNDQVLVIRATYPVGTESGMHTHIHPNRIAYFVRGGTFEIVPEDSSKPSLILEAEDGKTLFLPATTHNVRNVGDTEVVLLESEIKAR